MKDIFFIVFNIVKYKVIVTKSKTILVIEANNGTKVSFCSMETRNLKFEFQRMEKN